MLRNNYVMLRNWIDLCLGDRSVGGTDYIAKFGSRLHQLAYSAEYVI